MTRDGFRLENKCLVALVPEKRRIFGRRGCRHAYKSWRNSDSHGPRTLDQCLLCGRMRMVIPTWVQL